MKAKTAELAGAALDWAVAKCEGFTDYDPTTEKMLPPRKEHGWVSLCEYHFSADWAQAGPIIEREGVTVSKEDGGWSAYFRDNLFEDDGSEHWQTGPTPLIAAMRCYVASKLGAEVDLPEELT